MKISGMGMNRLLRASSLLVTGGLLAELVSILWFHPLSFVLFVFIAASLTGIGIVIFLASLVFVASSPSDDQGDVRSVKACRAKVDSSSPPAQEAEAPRYKDTSSRELSQRRHVPAGYTP